MSFDDIHKLISAGNISPEHLPLLRDLADNEHLYRERWEVYRVSESEVNMVFAAMNRWEGVDLLCEGYTVTLLEYLIINPANKKVVLAACRLESRIELMIHMLLKHNRVTDNLCHIFWQSVDGSPDHFGRFCRSALRVGKEREDAVGASNFRDMVGLVMRGLATLSDSDADAMTAAQGYESLSTFVRLVQSDDVGGGAHRYFVLERFSDTFLRAARSSAPFMHVARFLEAFVALDPFAHHAVWEAKIPQAVVRLMPERAGEMGEVSSIMNLLAGLSASSSARKAQVTDLFGLEQVAQLLQLVRKGGPNVDAKEAETDTNAALAVALKRLQTEEDGREGTEREGTEDEAAEADVNVAGVEDESTGGPSPVSWGDEGDLLLAACRVAICVSPDVETFASFFAKHIEQPILSMVKKCNSSNEPSSLLPMRALHDLVRRLSENVDMTWSTLDSFGCKMGQLLMDMLQGYVGMQMDSPHAGIWLRKQVHAVAALMTLGQSYHQEVIFVMTPQWLVDAVVANQACAEQWSDLPAPAVIPIICHIATLTLFSGGHGMLLEKGGQGPSSNALVPSLVDLLKGQFFNMALAEDPFSVDSDYLTEERSQLSRGDSDASVMKSVAMALLSDLLEMDALSMLSSKVATALVAETLTMSRAELGMYRRGCGELLASRQLGLIATTLHAGGPPLQRTANKVAQAWDRSGAVAPTLIEGAFSALSRSGGCMVVEALRVMEVAASSFLNLSLKEEEQLAALVLCGLHSKIAAVRLKACAVIVVVDHKRPAIMHRVFSRPEIEETLLNLLGADESALTNQIDRMSGLETSLEDIRHVDMEDVAYLQALNALARDVNETSVRAPGLSRYITSGSFAEDSDEDDGGGGTPDSVLARARGGSVRHLLSPDVVVLLEKAFMNLDIQPSEVETERADSLDVFDDLRDSHDTAIKKMARASLVEALFRSRPSHAVPNHEPHSRRWQSVAGKPYCVVLCRACILATILSLFEHSSHTFSLPSTFLTPPWNTGVALSLQLGVRVAQATQTNGQLAAGPYGATYQRTPAAMRASVESIIPLALEWVSKYTYRQTVRRRGASMKSPVEPSGLVENIDQAMTMLATSVLDALMLWPSQSIQRAKYGEFPLCAAVVALLSSYENDPSMQERAIRVLHSMSTNSTNLEVMTSMGIETISSSARQFTQDRDIMNLYLDVVRRAVSHEHGVYRMSVVECGALSIIWDILTRRWPTECIATMDIIYDLLDSSSHLDNDNDDDVLIHIRKVLCNECGDIDPIDRVVSSINRFKDSSEVLLSGGRLLARLIGTGAGMAGSPSTKKETRAATKAAVNRVEDVYRSLQQLSKGKLEDSSAETRADALRVLQAFPRKHCVIA
jgi:hypothetical protein